MIYWPFDMFYWQASGGMSIETAHRFNVGWLMYDIAQRTGQWSWARYQWADYMRKAAER